MQRVINLGRTIREKKKVSLKQPINQITIITGNKANLELLKSLTGYIEEELNVGFIHFDAQTENYTLKTAAPDHKAIAEKLKKNYTKDVLKKVTNLDFLEVQQLIEKGSLDCCGQVLELQHFTIKDTLKKLDLDGEFMEIQQEDDLILLVDFRQSEELKLKGFAREFTNRIQKMKKNNNIKVDDDILIQYRIPSDSSNILTCFTT